MGKNFHNNIFRKIFAVLCVVCKGLVLEMFPLVYYTKLANKVWFENLQYSGTTVGQIQ